MPRAGPLAGTGSWREISGAAAGHPARTGSPGASIAVPACWRIWFFVKLTISDAMSVSRIRLSDADRFSTATLRLLIVWSNRFCRAPRSARTVETVWIAVSISEIAADAPLAWTKFTSASASCWFVGLAPGAWPVKVETRGRGSRGDGAGAERVGQSRVQLGLAGGDVVTGRVLDARQVEALATVGDGAVELRRPVGHIRVVRGRVDRRHARGAGCGRGGGRYRSGPTPP